MSNTEYWIWLSTALGAGARTDEILSAYPDPEKLFRESRTERAVSGVFTPAKLNRLENTDISVARRAIDICNKNGWKIYSPDSENYPSDLKYLTDMPLVLYCDGDLACLDKKIAIGVVGTRQPTYDSVAIAEKLSADMAGSGVIIVSGGAVGIDSASHEGALSVGAPTICVLGCGLGTRYLMQNEAMRSEIAKNGAVITEYAPFTEAARDTFPRRNRIISGISKGLLVVEAGEKSGSLITARCAAEQGKEIFAVPGSILSSSYTGVNRLIRDGAKAVTCAEDILTPFACAYPGTVNSWRRTEKFPEGSPKRGEKKINSRKPLTDEFDGDAVKIYALLGNEPIHSDELCAVTGLSPSKVMAAVTELELGGFIEQVEGKNYILS